MDRREFLTKAAMAAALIGVKVTVTSCGGDDTTGPALGASDVRGEATGSGHTHTGVITKAQLDAGAGVTVTFTGSGHEHHLPLTDSEVQMLAQGQPVQKLGVTTNDVQLHPHDYTFVP